MAQSWAQQNVRVQPDSTITTEALTSLFLSIFQESCRSKKLHDLQDMLTLMDGVLASMGVEHSIDKAHYENLCLTNAAETNSIVA